MKPSLQKYRNKIDKIDKRIIQLLEKRFDFVKNIKKYKEGKNIPIEDKEREKKIIDSRAKNSRLSKNFIKQFFELVFNYSKNLQKNK